MKNLTEADYAISKEQHEMLIGKNGNFPQEFVNEGASQIRKLSIALGQYKDDAQEQEYINNLMAVDLINMRDKFTGYAKISKCFTVQAMCSLIVIDIEKILKNQNFDLNKLLKA